MARELSQISKILFCLAMFWVLHSICMSAQVAPAGGAPVSSSESRDLKHVRPSDTPTPAATTMPQSYALVIGIAQYQNLPASAQLRYPESDASAVYSTLISEQGGQFPAEHVHLLVGQEATRVNILNELEGWLERTTRENDRVLIYFAGHGFISGAKGYIAPYDIDLQDIAGSAIPMDLLGMLIGSKIKGKWKVLLSDACHSGAITPETDSTQVNHLLLNLNESIFSLTASRDREQSFESADWGGGHGIFTYYVVQGIAGSADANGDGVVTADELSEYVRSNVRAATSARQNPTSDRGSFDPAMVLAYNPDHVRAKTPENQAFGTLIVQANLDNTEFWLDDKLIGVVNRAKSLRLPGLTPGSHTLKAVHMGYEPDGPREQLVYPGQETAVTLRILIPRHRNQSAIDRLNEGVTLYKKGFKENYEKAEAKINEAIAIDVDYSEAYLYLGRVENALWKDEASLAAFQKALAIDPDFEEAKVSYAAALLDQGGLDEAVRQLNAALNQKSNDATALYLLSQAYARKGDYEDGKSAALRSIKEAPSSGEAHFWLAECERHLNEAAEAEGEYKEYLSLSNYNSGVLGNANYIVLGTLVGFGRKHHAAERDIWREQQGQANLGICDCEWMQKHYEIAIQYCQTALELTPADLWANYRLGVIYLEKVNESTKMPANPMRSQSVLNLLKEARLRFDAVISSNPDTDEAGRARQYIARIDAALSTHP